MNYHNITHDDMLNGDGLRVVLWVAGCNHHCPGCQNLVTWDPEDGIPFDVAAQLEIWAALHEPHCAGLTLSGGDPLYPENRVLITSLCAAVKKGFPDKTIWMYTGYLWHEVRQLAVMKYVDILVDGPYIEALRSPTRPWVGSDNQHVIDVQKSLDEGRVILWRDQNGEKRKTSEGETGSGAEEDFADTFGAYPNKKGCCG